MNYPCDFPPPIGKFKGCLPRVSKPGEVCPMFSDHIKVIPRREWGDYMEGDWAKDHVQKVKDQNGNGSCATEAAAGGTEIIEVISGQEWVELNPLFIYHTTSHGRDQGSSIDANLEFIREHGIAPESVWPRSKGFRTKPSEEACVAALDHKGDEFFDITTVEEMVTAVLMRMPVIWGTKGHAIVKVQHLNEREGLDLNSWATGWGDGGYGVWAPYNQINWAYGSFALRTPTWRK